MLRLEVLDYAGPTRWRWRLTDAGGAFVADHQVDLDAAGWEFEAFLDLHRYLRWSTSPDRRLAREAELLAQVGDWVGQRVLGAVATALDARREPVRLRLPPEAAVLGYLPWELARVDGRALAEQRVSVVIDQQPHRELSKRGVGERLRMLAVFSLPEGVGALNLRKERHELARLVHDIAKVNNKAIELRVLQYGATRARLEDALLEQAGWDVVHLSGHGLPAGLVLEDDAGRLDLISSTELVDLLDLASDQITLVTLSACESAALTATEHLHLLGLAPPTRDGEQPATEGSLPAVAAELVARLDCAVLAMRYPVVDDFAIALAGSFYDLVLGKGQPVARALALTLPRIAPRAAIPAAPALSIATPALFGARAAELTLTPPDGGPVELAVERQKLAGFPAQPDRFVGRVGPMTRATTALAPHSGRAGVLLHGMAGGGKTACALELAYTHQESFPSLAWYAAPPEGHAITTALTDFTLALERQLGLRLAHLVTDTATLRAALPGVTEVLEQNRVLIVLDNIESLLTDTGGWRDERWELLIEALTAHRGLSRLVLTSRRRPDALDPSMLVEAVHGLSLREAVLLARDWPNLGALIDANPPPAGLTEQQARELAARTLAVVQGHPKLIELADGHAHDPAALATRLAEADRSWLSLGTRLEPFLATGESAATDTDYLTVLQGWTRATTRALSADAATLFGFLCWVEEDDRMRFILDGNWADLWRRLDRPGEPADLDTALAPLTEQALVAAETDPDTGQVVRLRVHPGVADTGRAASTPEFAAAVDTELGDYWLYNLRHALQHEHDQEMGWLVGRAARSAAPYLLRQHRWNDLDTAAEQLLHRDSSSATAAALLPMLAAAVQATHNTEHELNLGRTHARTLAVLDPEQAETLFRELLDAAVARDRFGNASTLAGDLINLYHDQGRFDEALALADTMPEYTRRAGFGPWIQLVDQGMRLQILRAQGHYQRVLDEVGQLREHMATLPDPPGDNDSTAIPWNVRELLLNIGVLAARHLGRWQQALDLNAENLDSMRRRGATDTEQAFDAFNDYGPLLRLGRAGEARELLIRCRAVFEATNNIPNLGKTISALASVEDTLGRHDRAITLQTDALRYKYLAADPEAIGGSHHNLATHLQDGGLDPRQVWAHHLAAAVIHYQIGGGHLTDSLEALAGLLAADPTAAPNTFAQVCQTVEQVDGVHLADLLAHLPQRAPDGQTAMDEVLRLVPQAGADHSQQLIARWDSVLSALHTSLHHPDPTTRAAATHTLNHALTTRAQQPDWQALVLVLRRIHAGDRDPATLTDGLDPIDTAITQRALDLLNDQLDIDPDAWRTLTDTDEPD
ncbi:MAG: CHAT domain-containing protein [Actinomycetota bacterium]|nr:CHAT domain-containing protein [Actinomycetota bacterium]